MPLKMPDPVMLRQRPDRRLRAASYRLPSGRQQRLMVAALALLLAALGLLLYRDRDFWFPSTEEVADQPARPLPVRNEPAVETRTIPVLPKPVLRHAQKRPQKEVPVLSASATSLPPAVVTNRTVLPPLEVEVVAGDTRKNVRPGSSSIRVDLQPQSTSVEAETAVPTNSDPPANVATSAAERDPIAIETDSPVTASVRPDYPMLARQMKVQGSVVLQVLIGRDGLIQDLHVLSGPPILATAAREAVKQWHFKPHYMGNKAVETEATVTVNFTISTN